MPQVKASFANAAQQTPTSLVRGHGQACPRFRGRAALGTAPPGRGGVTPAEFHLDRRFCLHNSATWGEPDGKLAVLLSLHNKRQ